MFTLSRTILVAMFLLNAVVASYAQAAPKQAAETGAISGRVVGSGDDAPPLAGVGILLMPSEYTRYARTPAARATTDADGFYRLANVPAGSYRLQLIAPGYTGASEFPTLRPGEARAINIEAGETIEHQDFVLARGGVITGRVTDADGKPVVGESLRLAPPDSGQRPGFANVGAAYGFETDDRGIYRIYGLPAGRYVVCVGEGKDNGAVRVALSGRNRPHTCHPNATEAAQAKIIEVSSGSEATGVDITLAPPLKTYEASGRIIDAQTGQPVANLSYGFGVVSPDGRHIGSRGWSSAKTNAEGEFRLGNLLPGRYAAFVLSREGDASNYYSDALPFEIDEANLSGLVVKARRGATLRGAVSVEGATNPAVLAKLAQVDLQIRVVPSNLKPGDLQVGNSSRLVLQPNGSFFVAGLPPGRAQVSLTTFSSPRGFTLLGVERAASEQRDGIEIGEGEQVSDVRVRLAYGTTVVRGQVEVRRDGQPAQLPPGAQLQVTIRRTDGRRSGWDNVSAEVDNRGRFTVGGLIAGEYELIGLGWIRPSAAAPQGSALPGFRQIVSVPEKGEINVTMVYDLNAKPAAVAH